MNDRPKYVDPTGVPGYDDNMLDSERPRWGLGVKHGDVFYNKTNGKRYKVAEFYDDGSIEMLCLLPETVHVDKLFDDELWERKAHP